VIGVYADDRALAKFLNDRLAAESVGAVLPYDLVEKIGQHGMTGGRLLNTLGHAKPEVMEKDHDNWISDSLGEIAEEHFIQINEIVNKLRADLGVEVAVVTLRSCQEAGAASCHEFATDLVSAGHPHVSSAAQFRSDLPSY
jgi:hypothetical protein